MSLADDLERLHRLRQEGGLTAEEFEEAKRALLASPVRAAPPALDSSPPDPDASLGRAANRYVNFQIVWAVVGLVVVGVFLLCIMNSQGSGPEFFDSPGLDFP